MNLIQTQPEILTPEKLERRKAVVASHFYPVDLREEAGQRFVVNANTGEHISEVSDRYRLIPNSTLIQPFIEKFGVQNITHMRSFGKKQNIIVKIKTGRRFDISGQGDIIDEQVIIQNSYNKSKSFSFMMGAFRMVCSNGMYIGHSAISYKKIHVGEIPVDEIVAGALANYEKESYSTWKRFQEIPVTLEQEIELIQGFNAYEVKKDDAGRMESIFGNNALNAQIRTSARNLVMREPKNSTDPVAIDNPRNVWGLYNQLNRAIARNVRADGQVQELIAGNITAENYLMNAFNLN